MKLSTKVVLGFGGLCIASTVLGMVAFADTTSQNTTPQLQTDRATMKQLNEENKLLSQQISTDVQAWKTANPNPFKELTTSQQTDVKNLKADIKSEQATLKPLRDQFKSLRAQLKTARQNKDMETIAILKGQMQPLLANIKAGATTIKTDRQEIEAILPVGTMKSFYSKLSAFRSPLKLDRTTLKEARLQLKTDVQTLKADRQNHNQSAMDADIQKINIQLNQVISAKQQLLKDLSTEVPNSANSTN